MRDVEQFRMAGVTERRIAAELTERNRRFNLPPVTLAAVHRAHVRLKVIWELELVARREGYNDTHFAQRFEDLATFTSRIQACLAAHPPDEQSAARWAKLRMDLLGKIMEELGLAPTLKVKLDGQLAHEVTGSVSIDKGAEVRRILSDATASRLAIELEERLAQLDDEKTTTKAIPGTSRENAGTGLDGVATTP